MKKLTANDDGWCDWVSPIMTGYRMACCDCGLTHTMEFRVIRYGRNVKGTREWYFEDIKHRNVQVLFRVRRNNRSTANIRRRRKSGAPEYVWADFDPDYPPSARWCVYRTKADQRSNRPDLKPIRLRVLPIGDSADQRGKKARQA